MSTEPLSQALIQRAIEGDRSAFEELVGAFEGRIRAFIQARIQPASRGQLDLDEILQDTFVRAFRSMGSFRGENPEEFRRWLTGVANKTVLRAEHEARRHRALEIHPGLTAKGISPSKALQREERRNRLQEAIDSLTGDHRQVIFLTRIEGLSLKQAAERMGRSPEAVRKLFWRALQELRNTLSNTASLHLPNQELDWEKGDEHRR